MNLRWNSSFRRFEAEFSSDFQGDLAAVKAAGFKTDGAPEWIWYSYKAGPLSKLRTLRPGLLTISPEAREQFTPMMALEEKNAKLKAELATHNKALKKKLDDERDYKPVIIPEKGYIGAEDLPPMPPFPPRPIQSPDPNAPKCFICTASIYFYEKQDPPTCLWCEKIVLDNPSEVC